MKKIAIYVFMLVIFTSFLYSAQDKYERITSQIHKKYFVTINYIYYQPVEGLTYKTLEKSDYQQLYTFLEMFKEEFNKYPVNFVKHTFLTDINLVKNLRADGIRCRGVYCPHNNKIIFYNIYEIEDGYVLHHEFYHFIDREFKGEGALYQSKINNDWIKAQKMDPSKGYVSKYAKTNIVEDKAELFSHLMMKDKSGTVYKDAETDPVLKEKIRLLKNFLRNEGSPEIDEKFWQKYTDYDLLSAKSAESEEPKNAFEGIKIFPNPFIFNKDEIVKITNLTDNASVIIKDIEGKTAVAFERPKDKGLNWNGKTKDDGFLKEGNYVLCLSDGMDERKIKISYNKKFILFTF